MNAAASQNLIQTKKGSAELCNAYEFCREITRKHAKSFYFSARFLKKEKRLPIYALYALCRLVDDEVDGAEVCNEQQAIAAVEGWMAKLNEVYLGDQRSMSKVQI